MNQITFATPIALHIKTLTVESLRYTLIDTGASASVRFAHLPAAMVLWDSGTTPTYAEVGDYTQAQIEERVRDLLGSDPTATLAGLIPPFAP